MIKGRVHSIETFGTVDGPGIRYILFFQGCPLRCQYCHNRDTWDAKGGTEYTVAEIMDQVKSYAPYMKFSGGGITASGGEPTLQPEFLKRLFMEAKANEIHTALDTSGFIDIDTIDPILDFTDLVLLDIKHIDRDGFKNLTGVYNDKTLALAKHLNDRNIKTWIRYVLVPGVTDSEKDIENLAKFIATLDNVENIEILPYHTLGVHKWETMGYDYELKDVPPATKDDVAKASIIFEKHGLKNKLKISA